MFNNKMKPKILVAIISNQKHWPSYFCLNVMELMFYTINQGIKADLRTFSSVEVNMMRNFVCKFAESEKYTHIMMLDTDMKYQKDCIIKLLKHDKDFVVGTAKQRVPPFLPTQYKKFKTENFKDDSNRVNFTKDSTELTKIGSSGVVGALIKTKVLKTLNYPYFKVDYKKSKLSVTGGDVYFCKQLFENKIDLWCDPTIDYAHEVNAMVNRSGVFIQNG